MQTSVQSHMSTGARRGDAAVWLCHYKGHQAFCDIPCISSDAAVLVQHQDCYPGYIVNIFSSYPSVKCCGTVQSWQGCETQGSDCRVPAYLIDILLEVSPFV